LPLFVIGVHTACAPRFAWPEHHISGRAALLNNAKDEVAMRKFFYLLALTAGLPLMTACTKSVERAERDVQRAHDQAVQNIERRKEELDDTKRDAQDRIARKEHRLQETAQQETERIKKEERALDDAVRADARRHENNDSTIAPPVDRSATPPVDRSPLPPTDRPTSTTGDRRTKVDVNVNPGPAGGVNVDVNRNP
jgi:hypothetical protein